MMKVAALFGLRVKPVTSRKKIVSAVSGLGDLAGKHQAIIKKMLRPNTVGHPSLGSFFGALFRLMCVS